MGRASASGAAAVAPGYDPSIMAAATSSCVGGVMTGCVAPATVSATSVVGSPVCPIIISGTAAITGCSAIAEGAPCALVPACLAEGIDNAMGGA